MSNKAFKLDLNKIMKIVYGYVAIVAIVVAVMFYLAYSKYEESQYYASMPGALHSTKIVELRGTGSERNKVKGYDLLVDYSFIFDGREYNGKSIYCYNIGIPVSFNTEAEAKEYESSILRKPEVYFPEDDPSQSCLDRSSPLTNTVYLFVAILFLIPFIIKAVLKKFIFKDEN